MSDNNWPDRTGRKSRVFCSRYANCNVHNMQIAMSHNLGPDFLFVSSVPVSYTHLTLPTKVNV